MTNVTLAMQEALSRLPRTDSHAFRSRLNPLYDNSHAGLSITPGNALFALHRAREAQELAVSYRNFKVGAAITALSIGTPNFQIVTGINVKPDQVSEMNVHAEQAALQKVDDRGFTSVSMVAVVGETQNDSQSNKEMKTLHPCGLCRGVLSHHPAIHPENTLILSALPTLRTIEAYSLNALQNYHNNHDPSGIAIFEFPDMEILKPFVPASEAVQSLDELADNSEEVWDNTIGVFLHNWRMRVLNSENDYA